MRDLTIHSFLVHPAKNQEDPPAIGGTKVRRAKSAKLYAMLKGVFDKADAECNIDIAFDASVDGSQVNACRDLLLRYLDSRSLSDGRAVAKRLQGVTTLRSGMGLLFLMVGDAGKGSKIVLSRFPADNGILAEQDSDALTVEFIERVFMKSATAYKSALYQGSSRHSGFWEGRAVDRQTSHGLAEISDYWIKEFLASDFRTTSAAGTRRLAEALRAAVNSAGDIEVKTELTAAARLARGLNGQRTSISGFAERLQLSDAARTLLEGQVNQALRGEAFKFSTEEFDRHVSYRSVELDSGAILTALNEKFDEAFAVKHLGGESNRVRFEAEGRVVNDRLRKGSR